MFSFQFYQERGHLLGSWLYFITCTLSVQITEKMACGLQNGRGQPESVFLCFLHLQWINLFFAVSPLHGLSFLQNTTPQKEQKQTNKKPRNSSKKESTNPRNQKTKKQNKLHTQNGGRCRELGPVMFFVLFVFLVYCLFGSLFLLKGWQNKKTGRT